MRAINVIFVLVIVISTYIDHIKCIPGHANLNSSKQPVFPELQNRSPPPGCDGPVLCPNGGYCCTSMYPNCSTACCSGGCGCIRNGSCMFF